jgi:hypothetical protein
VQGVVAVQMLTVAVVVAVQAACSMQHLNLYREPKP